MLNEAVNECVRTSNRCAAICIQRARARFPPNDPTSLARGIALEREEAEAWRDSVDAQRHLARGY